MKVCGYVAATFMLTVCSVFQASAQETTVKWFGHAAFSITTPRGRVLLIDPWLRNPSNPDAKEGKDPLASVPRVDYILLTHGHRDHVGDAVEIARKTGAVLVCNPELAGNLVKLADFPGKQAETDAIMGIGGEIKIADGEVTVAMTPAVHSSSVFNPKSVRARLAVPQHFATFPGIAENPAAFAADLKRLGVPFYQMRPGETLTFSGGSMRRAP